MRRNVLNKRRDQIIALLSEVGMLSAAELAERMQVSVQTIRNDLRDLDEAALVQRRNGTVRLRQQSENIGYSPRTNMARAEKTGIAIAVKNLVTDGNRIALGTGTTVSYCARMLAVRENLFVATNNINAVMALQMAPGAVVEIAGGSVRMRDLDMIGLASSNFFANYRVDQAIFSCGGISEQGEVLDYNMDEIEARKAIASCARETILVVDSTKFAADLPCVHNHLWDYDVIVTGANLPSDIKKHCKAHGCTIITPPKDDTSS